MTATEIQKRNARAENLRVLQNEDNFFVESADGKILYRVTVDEQGMDCSCGDFQKGVKKDPNFRCKHLLSVQNCIPAGNINDATYLGRNTPKLDERWIITIEGNDFVRYAGLLDYGHQKGIYQIDVDPIQLPTKENGNFAICKATVVSKTGESFTDIGDANPNNCSSKVARHLLRLASTRAIARALRTYTNIGLTCLEELGDLNDVESSPKKKPVKQRKPAPKQSKAESNPPVSKSEKMTRSAPKQTAPTQKPLAAEPKQERVVGKAESNKSGPPMSEAQKRAIANLSRRRGISVEECEQMSVESFGVAISNLKSSDAAAFIRNLQQAA